MNRRRWLAVGLSVLVLGNFGSCDQSPPRKFTPSRGLITIDLAKEYEVEPGTSLSERLNEEIRMIAPKTSVDSDKLLFKDYQSAQAIWADNWTRNLNVTGVAWNTPQAGTLITDRHVVMSKHYQHEIGATLVFHDADGAATERTIIAREADPRTDMAIGLLNESVPDAIAVYPLLEPGGKDYFMLVDTWMLMTDNERKVLMFPVRAVAFAKDPNKAEIFMTALNPANRLDKTYEEELISGDSGHPTFLLSHGQLILMSVNTHGGNGMSGPYLGGAVNQAWIQTVVQNMD